MTRWTFLLGLVFVFFGSTASAQTQPAFEVIGPAEVFEGVLAPEQAFLTIPVQTSGIGTLVEPVFARRETLRDRVEVAPAGTRVFRVGIQTVENNRRDSDTAWCGETPYEIRFLFGSRFFCVVDNDRSGSPTIYQVDGVPVPSGFARRAFAESPPMVAVLPSERVANQRLEYRHGGYSGRTLVVNIFHVDDNHLSYVDQIRVRGTEGQGVVVSTRFGRFRFDRIDGRGESANVALVEAATNPTAKDKDAGG